MIQRVIPTGRNQSVHAVPDSFELFPRVLCESTIDSINTLNTLNTLKRRDAVHPIGEVLDGLYEHAY
jgi:hypothetical protein